MIMNHEDDDRLAERIKKANRDTYNRKSPEQYNENESIFNPRRRATCTSILNDIAARTDADLFLDVGTGTGNLLRLAVPAFRRCVGVDIGERLLSKVAPDHPDVLFAAADAEFLPFRDARFDGVSCYALLHHLLLHERLLAECHRILKPGGILYTDHDPNYFFNRFYHRYYRWRWRARPGFGSDDEELAEYHNTQGPGINPDSIRKILEGIGFSEIRVEYRHTDNEGLSLPRTFALALMKGVTKIVPARSMYTHFSVIAVK